MNRYLAAFFAAFVCISAAQATETYTDAASYSNAANRALSRAQYYNLLSLYDDAYLNSDALYNKYQAYLAGVDARNLAKHAFDMADLAYREYGWTYFGYYGRLYAYYAWLYANRAVPELWSIYIGANYFRQANNNLNWASVTNGFATYFLVYAITPTTP